MTISVRRIFFDKFTGEKIHEIGRLNVYVLPSVEQDVETWKQLSERNRETFDVIELPFEAYAQDFADSVSYRIDVDALAELPKDRRGEAIVFSIPDPDNSEKPIELPKPLSVQIEELKSRQLTENEKYLLLDLETTPLEQLKEAKIMQLDEFCNKEIIKGFIHTVNETDYLFSCSLSAQANFQGSDTLFKDGLINEAEWTVENVETGRIERIMINKDMFTAIKLQVFQHINSNISKLRNQLQPLVEAAQTNQEVDNITW
ncbi:hypothetical protein [Bacillus infantis]|uniref:hypothetical protein n=1 Tax=Bacillus infantis TaxID=324767 RepID=UPI003CE755D5